MWNQNIESHKFFIDDSTGFLRDEFVEERFCPVCQNKKNNKLFVKECGQYV